MRRLINTILFLLFAVPCWAADIYVSTSGNDSTGDGSQETPYVSLWKGYSSASAGDTIYLKRGDTWTVTVNRTVSEEAGVGLWIKANSITVDAYGTGDKPIINAESRTDRDDERGQNYYSPVEVGVRYGTEPTGVTIKNLGLRGPASGQAIAAYSTGANLTIDSCDIRGAGWTTEALIVAGNGDSGITLTGCSIDAIQGSTYYSKCIEIRGGGGHTIRGNTIKGLTAGGAVRFSNSWNTTQNLVEKNYFYYPDGRNTGSGAFALTMRGADGSSGSCSILIRNNVFDLTGSSGFSNDNLAALHPHTWYDLDSTLYVYNNTFVSDGAGECCESGGTVATYVYNNIIYDFADAWDNTADSMHFRNNIIYSCASGVETYGTYDSNVTTDPHLSNAAMTQATDAELTASSTNAINAGYGTPGSDSIPSDDYDGTARSNIDIGAFEYGAGEGDGSPASSFSGAGVSVGGS